MGTAASTQTMNDTEPNKQNQVKIYKQSDNITQSDEVTTTTGFKMNLRARVKVGKNAEATGNGIEVLEHPTRPKRQCTQTTERLDFYYGRHLSNASAKISKQSINKSTSESKQPVSKVATDTKNKKAATRKAAQCTRPKSSNSSHETDAAKKLVTISGNPNDSQVYT